MKKTKEISYQLSEVDLKEKDLIKAKETIVNFENVISKKNLSSQNLKNILDESEELSKLIEMKQRISELNQESDIKLKSHKHEIESFKQSILEKEESALKQIKEIEKLTNELLSKNEEIKTLETSEYRKQILSKDAEIDSLREKLETKIWSFQRRMWRYLMINSHK